MTFAQALGILVVEPYNQRLADIGEMDDEQIAEIFFPPRDGQGRPESTQRQPEQARAQERPDISTPRKWFFWTWRERGMDEETIERRWKQKLEGHPELNEEGLPIRNRRRG